MGKVEDRGNLLAGMSWCGCQLGARSKAQTKEMLQMDGRLARVCQEKTVVQRDLDGTTFSS